MVPKSRLGKRSPLGALVDVGTNGEGDGGPVVYGIGTGTHGLQRVKLYPGQRVFVHCGGQECGGIVEQHNHVDNEVSIFIPQLNHHVHRKLEDVWMTSTASPPHSVSSSIDVPKRSPVAVDMDEIMAAMVLTSLSCSPMIQSPIQGESGPASSGTDCGSSEVSDGGYWSCDHGNNSPAPSPPIEESDRAQVPPVDEGLEMEMENVLFDEPAPRKRKNSVKVAYRCLWPKCGKILTSIVGIKRHVRTLHLGKQNGEQERSQREEDFYYTEIYQDVEQTALPAACGAPRSLCGSPSSPTQLRSSPPTPDTLQPSPLSRSAPGSVWLVHSEHSYQASPPVQLTQCKPVPVPASSRWTPPLTAHQSKQVSGFLIVRPVTIITLSLYLQLQAKKCRKVYGIEHRDQWCTACRWKKACQRFLD
uniref:Zinc finger protein 395a n=1 Tax=Astyanax mexicanus TaxID=7994 RepID=A0A8B9LGX8_ASTMX